MSVNEDPTPPAASAPAASSMSAAASSAPTLHPLVALLGQAQRELNAFTNPDGVVGEAASDPTIGG
jgi:hypothetical protein